MHFNGKEEAVLRTIRVIYRENEVLCSPDGFIGIAGEPQKAVLEIFPPMKNAEWFLLDCLLPDGTRVRSEKLFLSRGALSFPVRPWMTAVWGFVTIQLRGYDSGGREIFLPRGTPLLRFYVAPGAKSPAGGRVHPYKFPQSEGSP